MRIPYHNAPLYLLVIADRLSLVNDWSTREQCGRILAVHWAFLAQDSCSSPISVAFANLWLHLLRRRCHPHLLLVGTRGGASSQVVISDQQALTPKPFVLPNRERVAPCQEALLSRKAAAMMPLHNSRRKIALRDRFLDRVGISSSALKGISSRLPK